MFICLYILASNLLPLSIKDAYISRSRYSGHEESVSRIAKEMGFTHVSLSSHTMPMVRIVPRGFTGTVTYHTPTQRFILIIPVHIGFGLTYHAHGTHCTSRVHRYGHLLYPDTEVHIDHTRTHWFWPHIPCPWYALYLAGSQVQSLIIPRHRGSY